MNLIISLVCLCSTLTSLVLLACYRRDFNEVIALQSRTFEEDLD